MPGAVGDRQHHVGIAALPVVGAVGDLPDPDLADDDGARPARPRGRTGHKRGRSDADDENPDPPAARSGLYAVRTIRSREPFVTGRSIVPVAAAWKCRAPKTETIRSPGGSRRRSRIDPGRRASAASCTRTS